MDINTNGATIINMGRIMDTYDAGLFSGTGGMTLIASVINNTNGHISSKGNVVTNTSSTLNNNGRIDSDSNIMIKTNGLNNNKGQIKSADDPAITANSIVNNFGEIRSDAQATLELAGSYSHYGTLTGREGVNINAEKGNAYNFGTLSSENGLTTINSRSFFNQRNAAISSPAEVQVVLGKPGSFASNGSIDGDLTIIRN